MKIVDQDLIANAHRAYFIGIGGVGMSALARVLKHQGLNVCGSDCRESRTTRELTASGISVFIGQEKVSFGDSDLIIYSSAIGSEHVELKTAREQGRKVHHRAEILSSLLNRAKTSVAVTGTHGKTTTSSMISFLLSELGENPTCLVGGDVLNLGTNTVLGNRDLWVSEVDESDQTHEMYAPNYAIITNLEEDHMDHYHNLDALKHSFERFIENTRDPGLIIYCAEDACLRELVAASRKPRLSYGFSLDADFSAQNVLPTPFGSEYDLYEAGLFVMRVKLSVPGFHNVLNSLAALAVLIELGMDLEALATALADFRGARRRLEIKWQSEDLMVIDDYAHHPTEVKASLRALKSTGKHLTVVFQPHRFSRTQYLFKSFGTAFQDADELILTEIYSAGEENPERVGVQCIYNEIMKHGTLPVQILRRQEILNELLARPHLNGVVAFLGAGDIGEIADECANRFKSLATA